ncbi:unnamed protein product, partial [Didymodactylos carnosus]
NTDPNEDNAYSNDNVNDSQHQDYLGRDDTEQNVDEEFTSTYIKVITSTIQDHSPLLQQQQPSILDDNQSAASLPNTDISLLILNKYLNAEVLQLFYSNLCVERKPIYSTGNTVEDNENLTKEDDHAMHNETT